MSTLTLSGWTQPADALTRALGLEATAFDYSDYTSLDEAFAALRPYADSERVVGWSLGGNLAIRAIANGVLRPKKLTLIAAPYQFVSDADFRGGMDPLTYQQFRENYASNPTRTMQRFHALIAKGDTQAKMIMGLLGHHPEVADTGRWLPWLDLLGSGSLRHTDLTALPPTLLVQGMQDAIVPYAQAEALAARMPQARIDAWEDTGHAPHLRDKLRLTTAMNEHP